MLPSPRGTVLLLANLANWVTLGSMISLLLLAFPGGGLVGEVKLAVLLLGFATGVSWRGEIGRAAAGIWKCCCWVFRARVSPPAILEMLLRIFRARVQPSKDFRSSCCWEMRVGLPNPPADFGAAAGK